jgi:hypothetical protein
MGSLSPAHHYVDLLGSQSDVSAGSDGFMRRPKLWARKFLEPLETQS